MTDDYDDESNTLFESTGIDITMDVTDYCTAVVSLTIPDRRVSTCKWQFFVTFRGTRNNQFVGGTYGSADDFETVYEKAVSAMGYDFVEVYLNTVFPYTIKELLEPYLNGMSESSRRRRERKSQKNMMQLVQDGVQESSGNTLLDQYIKLASQMYNDEEVPRTKEGLPDFRFKQSRDRKKALEEIEEQIDLETLREFLGASSKDVGDSADDLIRKVESQLDDISEAMREDIKRAILVGEIGGYVKPRTEKARVKAGLPSQPAFLASEQLIDSIVVIANFLGKSDY